MRASPAGGGSGDFLNLSIGVDIADSITEVTGSGTRVRGDNDVGSVLVSLFGEDKVTVDIGRSQRVTTKARSTEQRSERLLAIGVTVENGKGLSIGLSREGLVGQESETVIVGNQTTGLLAGLESDDIANGSKSLGVNALDVDTGAAGVEVGEEGLGTIRRDSEGSSSVVREASPVSLFNGIEGVAESQGVDVVLERGRCELSSSQRQAGGKGEKTRHYRIRTVSETRVLVCIYI